MILALIVFIQAAGLLVTIHFSAKINNK